MIRSVRAGLVRLVVVIFVLFCLSIGFQFFGFFEHDKERLVGITSKGKKVPCSVEVKGTGPCYVPDPSGTKFTLRIPPEMQGVGNLRRYEFDVVLSVYVTKQEIRPVISFRDLRPLAGSEISYISSGQLTVSAADEEESSDEFVRREVDFWQVGNRSYRVIPSDVKNTYLYDDVNCAGKDGATIARLNECGGRKRIYVSTNYSYAYASCAAPPISGEGEKSFSCKVVSRVAPGLKVRYLIYGSYLVDGSWIEFDKRIREYIGTLEAK